MNNHDLALPHDTDIERALLGKILRDDECLSGVLDLVPEDALSELGEHLFTEQSNIAIFSSILEIHKSGMIADPVTLLSRLRENGRLEEAGGAIYISDLIGEPLAATPEQYTEMLLEKWRARRQIRILSDIQKRLANGDQDIEWLKKKLEEAKSQDRAQNQAPTLAAFMATPRPALQYHIKGFLPERGKMTISAVAKGYKTTLLIELGLCAAAGRCQYLNFEFQEPARVLLVQPELSDGLVAERMAWIMRSAPEWLNRLESSQNFHILETAAGRPTFWPSHPRGAKSRKELETAIESTGAQILMVDSLYMSFAGLDENAAEDMTLALDYLGDLTNRFGVAIILSHHFNKSGTARGSSVYQGWGETDLAIATVPKDPSVVQVDALLRCSFARGFPAYWQKPDEHTAWFELIPEDWRPEKVSGVTKAPPKKVNDHSFIVALRGKALSHTQLEKDVSLMGSCCERTASRAIADAVKRGVIIKGNGYYTLPQEVSGVNQVS